MTDQTARDRLIAYATTTRTVTVDGLDPLLDAVLAEAAVPSAVPASAASARRTPCPAREPLLGVQCAKEAGHEAHSDRPGRIWYPVADDGAPAADRAEPVCKFDEGCHRVVACEPGCAVTAADMHAQLAAPAAVLPASVVPAGVVARETDDLHAWYAAQDDEAPASVDRATVLLEAADEAANSARLFPDDDECATAIGALEGLADLLRRLAVEARDGQTTQGEARLDRVREWVTSDVVTARNEFGNGYREAQRDIRDLLDGQQPTSAGPAGGAQQAPPTVGYSGKGRVWCLRCSHPVDEDVPVTGREVSDWEICASCGRHVLDVARWVDERTAAQQPKEA